MAVTEGQQVIMALISKRLRAHRKKYNRITAMEESVSQGQTLNKEQQETIRSKPIVTALIEELEKLRIPPPSTAVSDEMSLPSKKNKKKKEPKVIAEEKDVTSKTDIDDCKISDDVEGLKDNITPCSVSSEGVTPSPPSASKPRRKRKSKKPPQTST